MIQFNVTDADDDDTAPGPGAADTGAVDRSVLQLVAHKSRRLEDEVARLRVRRPCFPCRRGQG
jgi:hypothetical protein